MTYHIKKVGEELSAWNKVKSMIEDDCLDEQCLMDTLDGETELFEALCLVKETVLEDEIILTGLKAYIEKLTKRAQRIVTGIETKNNVILSAMITANVPTIKGPLFTLSQSKTAQKVVVSNESEIPTKFWKSKDPIIDKVALKTALKEKEIIPGATLSNGGVSLKTRIL